MSDNSKWPQNINNIRIINRYCQQKYYRKFRCGKDLNNSQRMSLFASYNDIKGNKSILHTALSQCMSFSTKTPLFLSLFGVIYLKYAY